MPFSRAQAPSWVPDSETIESLLSERNETGKKARKTKPLQDLSDEENVSRTSFSWGSLSDTSKATPGGGFYAGRLDIMIPLLREMQRKGIRQTDHVDRLRCLLQEIPNHDISSIAARFGNDGNYSQPTDDYTEKVVTFSMGKQTVRLMQAKDADLNKPKSLGQTMRSKLATQKANELLSEPPMEIPIQQYLGARHLYKVDPSPTQHLDEPQASIDDEDSREQVDPDVLEEVRIKAQEEYWLLMAKDERAECAKNAQVSIESQPVELRAHIRAVRASWPKSWNNGQYDPDFFRNYARDQCAAQNVLKLIEEDIIIVTDKSRGVIFANIEKLGDILFGEDGMQTLYRCLDMWSFFTPLPLPETSRHVVDNHIRRIHPELDPAKATVAILPNARMAVAHYGCWAQPGDPNGRNIHRTWDARFNRSVVQDYPVHLFPDFCKAVLGTATKMFRFMMQPLDPAFYEEGTEIWKSLESDKRIITDDGDFLSLFALGVNGYTQRHRDIQDITGGLAGLFSTGDYRGGNLCIPQLGLKVPYRPGTCAILRGTPLEHFVQDYQGTRFFIIGTSHESCKRWAWRKLGRLPPLPPPKRKRTEEAKDSIEEGERNLAGTGDHRDPTSADMGVVNDDDGGCRPMLAPCVNLRSDDDDEDIVWTNLSIHGPAVLDYREAGVPLDLNE
ncbi:hypothetical protein F5Y15DRAFT_425475 [Xylariaceae sp. FL0016]|nr:hypothetical protein F5Y15DRAFT_425475 [Xylariaceae sp. FL0016]